MKILVVNRYKYSIVMAHPYVIRRKVDKSGGKEKVLYYAVPKVKKHSGNKELAEIIHERSTYTEGDIIGALTLLAKVIPEQISKGYSVQIENFGTFYLSAGSDGFEKMRDCTPGKVKALRICFKADRSLRKSLDEIQFELNEIIKYK